MRTDGASMKRVSFVPGLVTAVVILALLASAPIIPVSAQDDVLQVSVAPEPELCTLEPRTLEELEALVSTDILADQPDPTPFPEPFEMPEGFSLFEDEQSEVEKDLIRAVSCFNTGDPLRVFATYTDRYVATLLGELGGLTDQVRAGLTTIRPVEPNQYVTILSFGESVLLDDGRVAVVVFGDDLSNDDPPGPRLFLLDEVLPGRWLIDEVVDIEQYT